MGDESTDKFFLNAVRIFQTLPIPVSVNGDPDSPLLDSLNKLNIFIGQNNSGKSLFLRWLFQTNLCFKIYPEMIFDDKYVSLLAKITKEVEDTKYDYIGVQNLQTGENGLNILNNFLNSELEFSGTTLEGTPLSKTIQTVFSRNFPVKRKSTSTSMTSTVLVDFTSGDPTCGDSIAARHHLSEIGHKVLPVADHLMLRNWALHLSRRFNIRLHFQSVRSEI